MIWTLRTADADWWSPVVPRASAPRWWWNAWRRRAPASQYIVQARSDMTARFPHALRLPVFAAPMFLISGPDLVLAACRAGVIGAFPSSNCRTVADLDQWMAAIRDRLGAEQPANRG